jgi:1-deoxy-D-xylulose-5-phosphate synthase
VLSNGTIGNNATLAQPKIIKTNTIAHYDFPFVKPLTQSLHQIFSQFDSIIT